MCCAWTPGVKIYKTALASNGGPAGLRRASEATPAWQRLETLGNAQSCLRAHPTYIPDLHPRPTSLTYIPDLQLTYIPNLHPTYIRRR